MAEMLSHSEEDFKADEAKVSAGYALTIFLATLKKTYDLTNVQVVEILAQWIVDVCKFKKPEVK